MMRGQSKRLFIGGASGGFLGYFLQEPLSSILSSIPGGPSGLLAASLRFAFFGFLVGTAIGSMGVFVQPKPQRRLNRICRGTLFGCLFGLAGGIVGEGTFELGVAKLRDLAPSIDLVIVLDASRSMNQEGLLGTIPRIADTERQRIAAAQELVDMLGNDDRVAIVSFNHVAQTHLPLTLLDSPTTRNRVRRAIRSVGSEGGTSLTAGLQAALEQLIADTPFQSRNLIFLTDGIGNFKLSALRPALDHHIRIYTIGLGQYVDRALLRTIARQTGGNFYATEDAAELEQVFAQIYAEQIDASGMTEPSEGNRKSPILFFLFRTLSWGAAGLALGIAPGITSQGSLKACSLGGLIGGMVGGAAFDPIVALFGFGSGGIARVFAGTAIGAFLGGSAGIGSISTSSSEIDELFQASEAQEGQAVETVPPGDEENP